MSTEKFEEFYFRVCTLDYEKMSKAMDNLVNLMNRTKNVHNNGILFNNIKFEFENGKIIKATSNKTKELNEILNTDKGSRYIGEFALGLNPYIEKPIGDTLFDEKIKGSFHFTLGDSLEESDIYIGSKR